MNRFLFIILAVACMGLTPAERKIVKHAEGELRGAKAERDLIKTELAAAQKSAADSAVTAKQTEVRAEAAEKDAKEQHRQLVVAVAENDRMRPIVEAVNRWWGIGGIIYGFKRLAVHLLILVGAIIVLLLIVSIASKFVPWLAPVALLVKRMLAAIGGLWQKLWKRNG